MASVVRQRNQQQCDNEESAPGLDGVTQQPAAQEGAPKAAAVAAAAAKRLHKQTLYKRIQHRIRRVKSWLWWLVEELFEEFQPWLKWIIFDAALTLLVGQLVKQVEFVRPLFEAVGWA